MPDLTTSVGVGEEGLEVVGSGFGVLSEGVDGFWALTGVGVEEFEVGRGFLGTGGLNQKYKSKIKFSYELIISFSHNLKIIFEQNSKIIFTYKSKIIFTHKSKT